MLAYGFDWVWLDGDRGAAFHSYFSARDGEAARFVDPFEADGRFRPVAALLGDVLEPGPVVQPVPERRRTGRAAFAAMRPAGGRARAGLAGAAAFTMAGIAAAAYLLVGGIGGKGVQAAQAKPATIPATGILVSGESLGGVRLGDTRTEVRNLWGHKFTVCEGCEPTTWFYWYPSGESGLGVEFRQGQVTGVYTLGRTVGWRSTDGLKIGGYMSNKELQEKSVWKSCPGYSAKLETTPDAVDLGVHRRAVVYGVLADPAVRVRLPVAQLGGA